MSNLLERQAIRREDAYRAFEGQTFVVATNGGRKVKAARELATGFGGEVGIVTEHAAQALAHFLDIYTEPFGIAALEVATTKAAALARHMERMMGQERVKVIGADGMFAWYDPRTLEKHPLSKLERLGREMTPQELEQHRQYLLAWLCEGERVIVEWEDAATVVNGEGHGFDQRIVIVSRPLDREQVNMEFDKSVAAGWDGPLYGMNSGGIPLAETLLASGRVQQVGIIPDFATTREAVRACFMDLHDTQKALGAALVTDVASTVPQAMFKLDFPTHFSTWLQAFSIEEGIIKKDVRHDKQH